MLACVRVKSHAITKQKHLFPTHVEPTFTWGGVDGYGVSSDMGVGEGGSGGVGCGGGKQGLGEREWRGYSS